MRFIYEAPANVTLLLLFLLERGTVASFLRIVEETHFNSGHILSNNPNKLG